MSSNVVPQEALARTILETRLNRGSLIMETRSRVDPRDRWYSIHEPPCLNYQTIRFDRPHPQRHTDSSVSPDWRDHSTLIPIPVEFSPVSPVSPIRGQIDVLRNGRIIYREERSDRLACRAFEHRCFRGLEIEVEITSRSNDIRDSRNRIIVKIIGMSMIFCGDVYRWHLYAERGKSGVA